MKLLRNLSERNIEILIFLIPLVLFSLTISNGLNVFDFINYASLLQKAFASGNYALPFQAFGAYGGGQGGLSRNSFFIALSYPFTYLVSNLLGVNIEQALNIFSSLATSLSVVFVYKVARLFWKRYYAYCAVLIYLCAPFIFFNGINATTYSLELLTSSIWIYFLLKGIKQKSQNYGILSSVFFLANSLTSLAGAPLIFAQIYGLTRIEKRRDWILKNLILLSIVAILVYYFSFINKAYPTTFNFLKIFFMGALFVWESANGLSLAFFLAVSVSIFYLLIRLVKRKTDYFDNIFILSFLFLLSSLSVFQFIPIANFTPLLVLFPILAVRTFSDSKYFKVLVAVVLLFAVVKTAPLAYMFHASPHPHKAYALWIDQIAQGSVVLAGHECPWVQYYTNLTVVCRGRDLFSLNYTGKVVVTEEYFENENQMDFQYLVNSFNLPFSSIVEAELGKPDVIANKTFTKIATYSGPVRPIEDPYQWLYTIYPKFYQSVFFNYEFLKPSYGIYSVN